MTCVDMPELELRGPRNPCRCRPQTNPAARASFLTQNGDSRVASLADSRGYRPLCQMAPAEGRPTHRSSLRTFALRRARFLFALQSAHFAAVARKSHTAQQRCRPANVATCKST